MRKAWAAYECRPEKMVQISFGPDRIRVAPPTEEAWQALASVLAAFDYEIRTGDTDSYNCREVKGGGGRSLHSYGIALDINWKTNPYRDHSGERRVRYARGMTQDDRAEEVRVNTADTDMTAEMIRAALAIRTRGGKPVFGWGGNWKRLKDAMHFQIELTPGELSEGIDWGTVQGGKGELGGSNGRDQSWSDSHAHNQTSGSDAPLGDFFPGISDLQNDPGVVLSEGDRGSTVKALQDGLKGLNYQLGASDGYFGPLTRDALLSFQANNNLPVTGIADAQTFAALGRGKPKMLSPDRTSISEPELLQKGSTTINAAGWERWLGIGTGILGAFGILDTSTNAMPRFGAFVGEQVPALSGLAPAVGGALSAAGAGPWGVVLALGYFILRNANTATTARLRDHRSGANIGR
jgi:hypothetical protein